MCAKLTKREFLQKMCYTASGAFFFLKGNHAYASSDNRENLSEKPWKWSKLAMFSENTDRGIKCLICPNSCILKSGDTSFCRSRINYKGELYSIAYGNPCAIHVDPIEKKPFYHFLPGSRAFSIAAAGCNFSCLNCQNWSISQASPRQTRNYDLMPSMVAQKCAEDNCKSIAYTYSEPVTFYEYMYDSCIQGHERGIKNVLVSNGYINEKPLRQLCKVIDGATIDLKSFDESTYIKLNAGSLQPVLKSLKIYKEEGVWLEISYLLIPGWSDSMEMIKKMVYWLYNNGFNNTPLHFLRFQPMYKLTQIAPTPVLTLQKARNIALNEGIRYVYIGNVAGSEFTSTYCPKCKQKIIERKGNTITYYHLKGNSCGYCGEIIAGRWN